MAKDQDKQLNKRVFENYQWYGKQLEESRKRKASEAVTDVPIGPAGEAAQTRPQLKKQKLISGLSEPEQPEEQQETRLFEHLEFLFLPSRQNSNIFKKRVKTFEHFGARVTDEAVNALIASHILIPSDWTRVQVIETLKKNGVEPSSVRAHLAYDEWPSLCIEAGVLRKDLYLDWSFSSNHSDPEHQTEMRLESPTEVSQAPNIEMVLKDGSQPDELSRHFEAAKIQEQAEALLSDDEHDTNRASDDEHGYQQRKSKLERFLCMEPSSSKSRPANPNDVAITKLTLLMNHYEALNDSFRVLAYRKAIRSLQRTTEHITTYEQAKRLFGVGSRLAKKIEEAANTGTIKKLDYASESGQGAVLALLRGIYGVGIHTALKWYKNGVRTLEDVAKLPDLTENQRVGLAHYDDLQDRIPRSEVKQHYEIVCKALKEIDPDIQPELMGSYRRGAPDCGDIDIIFTKPKFTIVQLRSVLDKLLSHLTETNFLRWTFAGLDKKSDKWLGATAIGPTGKWRRMDILLVPYECRAGFYLYYTGNDLFNRSMRLLARQKGYKLSEKGLFIRKQDVRHGDDTGPRLDNGTEEDIFDKLDIKYRAPTERNVG